MHVKHKVREGESFLLLTVETRMDNRDMAASMRRKKPEIKKRQIQKIVERVEILEEKIKNLKASKKPSKEKETDNA